MDGIPSVRDATQQAPHKTVGQVSDTEYGRGSFLGQGFRVIRSASPNEARIEVYSKDRWWLMCRICRLSSSVPQFHWQREWLRVGQPWHDGVEAAAREILAEVSHGT